jgi:hypothetical protein
MDDQIGDKDQNVYSFMMQLVQEKLGDDTDYETLTAEADRLYDIFGDVLLAYFEPKLDNEQKQQFDQLIENGEDQDILMSFLVENIDNLESRIIEVLVAFRADYLNDNMKVPKT